MSDWESIYNPPPIDEPCEYIIEVRCKGWYKPIDDEPTFAVDDRSPPQAKLTRWRYWPKGESWEEGRELVRKFRETINQDKKE